MNDTPDYAGKPATDKKSQIDQDFELERTRFHESRARGLRWAAILEFRPDLADKCDWSKFDGTAWRSLLIWQPGFADRCDKWNAMDGCDWANLLARHPEFADKCDWTKLNGRYWSYLLAIQPQFADKCDETKLRGRLEWAYILAKQPQLADKCDWTKLGRDDWLLLLFGVDKFGFDNYFSARDAEDDFDAKSKIQPGRPEFADRCPWSKFSPEDWVSILANFPQFADWCDWAAMDDAFWVNLLRRRPEFADRCDPKKLGVTALIQIGLDHPELAESMKLAEIDWARLNLDEFEGSFRTLAAFAMQFPQYAKKCDWEKLAALG